MYLRRVEVTYPCRAEPEIVYLKHHMRSDYGRVDLGKILLVERTHPRALAPGTYHKDHRRVGYEFHLSRSQKLFACLGAPAHPYFERLKVYRRWRVETRFDYFVYLLVFIVASLTDTLDGYLARKWKQVTDLGKFLDPVADKMLVNADNASEALT